MVLCVVKRFFSGFAVLAAFLTAGSVTEVVGDPLTYRVLKDGVRITDCDKSVSGGLVIPSTYQGIPVTTIRFWAFRACRGLTSVTIPDSVNNAK